MKNIYNRYKFLRWFLFLALTGWADIALGQDTDVIYLVDESNKQGTIVDISAKKN